MRLIRRVGSEGHAEARRLGEAQRWSVCDDGFDHAEGLGVGGDFVDAVDVGALFAEPGGEGDGGPVAVGDVVEAGEEGEHGLAGDADEEGAVGDAEVGEVAEELQVVVEGFAEAEAGVEDDACGVDAGVGEDVQSAFEVGADFGDDILISGGLLHGGGGAAHVHDDEAGGGFGGELDHAGIASEAGDVVDDVGSGGEGGAGDGGFHGVDGEEGAGLGADGADDGDDAADFFFGGDGFGAGAGGFATEVEDFGAFGEEVEGVFDGAAGIEEAAAVGEGVGGDIDDAHDEGAGADGVGGAVDEPGLGVGVHG